MTDVRTWVSADPSEFEAVMYEVDQLIAEHERDEKIRARREVKLHSNERG